MIKTVITTVFYSSFPSAYKGPYAANVLELNILAPSACHWLSMSSWDL